MAVRREDKPYKIVCAYDSETNNIASLYNYVTAYPICHQFGFVDFKTDVSSIDNANVETLVKCEIVRHTEEAYSLFDGLIMQGKRNKFVPVVMVHNLSFDMWALSDYLNRYDVRVLAKSNVKPITFTLLDGKGKPMLVLWDTLVFFQRSLAALGNDCGFPKLVGDWDYNRQRTPETPLTEKETAYALHDIYTLWAYMGYWLRQNTDIDESALARNIVTKTGVVRYKRRKLFDQTRGNNQKFNVGRFWNFINRENLPKSDDELYTMHACTRGGFTFCSRRSAGVPFNLDGSNLVIAGYDATSQHPAQMVSHLYPERFKKASIFELELNARVVRATSLDFVLGHWAEPFPVAFNACFEFKNLRYKKNSIFEREGISPLAWARTTTAKIEFNPDNQNSSEFKEAFTAMGYKDYADDETHSFGKLESAETCILWLTELAFWEVCQVFDFDAFKPICGYHSGTFIKPTDMSVLSVMHFYAAKNVYKAAKEQFDAREPITNGDELKKYVSEAMANAMIDGSASDIDVRNGYLGVKADLNSLFGIEATSEARADMVLTANGIESKGAPTLDDLPDNPKAFYQFGQRIVGWSRIAQICVMLLAEPYIERIINGDTDSVKFLVKRDKVQDLTAALEVLGSSIDQGRKLVTSRVKRCYPDEYVELTGIGHYVLEFEADRFAASWNKCYCIQRFDKKFNKMRFAFTLAGVTVDARHKGADGREFANSFNDIADYLYYEKGWTFEQIVSLLLGYNVTIDHSVTKLNGRHAPKWGSYYNRTVTDWQGNTAEVNEPCAMALHPMPKTIGGFENEDNRINAYYAALNNPNINIEPVILSWEPFKEPRIDYLKGEH